MHYRRAWDFYVNPNMVSTGRNGFENLSRMTIHAVSSGEAQRRGLNQEWLSSLRSFSWFSPPGIHISEAFTSLLPFQLHRVSGERMSSPGQYKNKKGLEFSLLPCSCFHILGFRGGILAREATGWWWCSSIHPLTSGSKIWSVWGQKGHGVDLLEGVVSKLCSCGKVGGGTCTWWAPMPGTVLCISQHLDPCSKSGS